MVEPKRDNIAGASSVLRNKSPMTVLAHAREAAPSELSEVVLQGLREFDLADQTMARVTETVVRFTAYLERGHGSNRSMTSARIMSQHLSLLHCLTLAGAEDRRLPRCIYGAPLSASTSELHVNRAYSN